MAIPLGEMIFAVDRITHRSMYTKLEKMMQISGIHYTINEVARIEHWANIRRRYEVVVHSKQLFARHVIFRYIYQFAFSKSGFWIFHTFWIRPLHKVYTPYETLWIFGFEASILLLTSTKLYQLCFLSQKFFPKIQYLPIKIQAIWTLVLIFTKKVSKNSLYLVFSI